MIKKSKWTTEEERVLVDQIVRSASIKEACKKAARLIDRTEAACMYHWYTVITKKEDPSMYFITRHKTQNITSTPNSTFASWWKRLLNFLRSKLR